MAWPTSLQVALKEWAVTIAALQTGRQIILLRKGGIYEESGQFQIEHRQFLFYPTYVHQTFEMLKPEVHPSVKVMQSEPGEVRLESAGIITDIIPIKSRATMDALDEQHIWAKPLIDMRFRYRPENPLYLLFVRAYRLHQPLTLETTEAFAGCKSWVPLDQPIATGDALPVLDDVKYEFQRKTILDKIAMC
jgi:hypothetical protein